MANPNIESVVNTGTAKAVVTKKATKPAAPAKESVTAADVTSNTIVTQSDLREGLTYDQYLAEKDKQKKSEINLGELIPSGDGGPARLGIIPTLDIGANKGTAPWAISHDTMQNMNVDAFHVKNLGLCSDLSTVVQHIPYMGDTLFLSVWGDRVRSEYGNNGNSKYEAKLGHNYTDTLGGEILFTSPLSAGILAVTNYLSDNPAAKDDEVLGRASFGAQYFRIDNSRTNPKTYNVAKNSEGSMIYGSTNLIGPLDAGVYKIWERGYIQDRSDSFWPFNSEVTGYDIKGSINLPGKMRLFASADIYSGWYMTTTTAGANTGEISNPAVPTGSPIFTSTAAPVSDYYDRPLQNWGRTFKGELRFYGLDLLSDQGVAVDFTYKTEQIRDLKATEQTKLGVDLWKLMYIYGARNTNVIERYLDGGPDKESFTYGVDVNLPITGKGALSTWGLNKSYVDLSLQASYYNINGIKGGVNGDQNNVQGIFVGFKTGFGGKNRPDQEHQDAYSSLVFANYEAARARSQQNMALIDKAADKKVTESTCNQENYSDGSAVRSTSTNMTKDPDQQEIKQQPGAAATPVVTPAPAQSAPAPVTNTAAPKVKAKSEPEKSSSEPVTGTGKPKIKMPPSSTKEGK